jgi:hypothetical protein
MKLVALLSAALAFLDDTGTNRKAAPIPQSNFSSRSELPNRSE